MKEKENHGIIEHEGIVRKVDTNSVVVSISSSSACAGCHAEGLCSITGREEKSVDIQGKYNVVPGENVKVLMIQSMGIKAIILSYLIPLVIVITTLSVLVSLSVSELVSGILSISLLLPYFTILYLFRKRINKSFTFTLKKISS